MNLNMFQINKIFAQSKKKKPKLKLEKVEIIFGQGYFLYVILLFEHFVAGKKE